MIDLHLHTTASDGQCTPGELVRRVHRAGIGTLSVTDHDTVAALPAAAVAAARLGLTLVTGIEITAVDEGRDVHMLGYFFDPAAPVLERFLTAQREDRLRRVRAMAGRLASLGAPIDVDGLLSSGEPGRALARPHVAAALVEAGHVADVAQAFERYLAAGRPAFVERRGSSPSNVVAIVAEAGGLTSLAHPGLLGRDGLIPVLAAAGLDAIEAYHTDHDAATTAHYLDVARDHGLLVTGGSDYHGDGTRRAAGLGRSGLPADAFEALSDKAARRSRAW